MTKTEQIKKLVKENSKITNYEIIAITGASSSLVFEVAGSDASRGLDTKAGAKPTCSKEHCGCTSDLGSDKGTVIYRVNKHIKDIPTALEEQGIDLNVWEIFNVKTIDNKWDVYGTEFGRKTNYQFKITISLRKRKDAPIRQGIESLIERIPALSIPKVTKFKPGSGTAAAVAPLDAHMGKFAWAKETGRRDYGLKQSREDYLEGVGTTLSWCEPFAPERIFYIVGQDLMHIENFMAQTPMGHNTLDVDNRLPKVFEYAMDTVISSIAMCAQVAPVTVLHVPGNHDMHASLFLCMMLKRLFADNPDIEIDDAPLRRKAIQWGKLLVGMTHEIVGRHQSWANELMQQFPHEFAATEYHEWWHGHKHKKNEVKTFPITTHGGVLMRQLTALSPIDAWHYDHLFTDAVPGSEAFLMDKRHGVIANFTYWTDKPQVQKNLARVYE